jgi:ubiquinone/menaquinone biosynthesis C-methylase UbiE
MTSEKDFAQDDRAQVKIVRHIFNDMVDEYDDLTDLWYSYTFGEIDRVLLEEFEQPNISGLNPIAIDVGCGTGLQSIRLASLGYKVIGFDIADKLIEKARNKVQQARSRHEFLDVDLLIADAEALPFADSVADCINCCGPTLSFVPDWRQALSEISRCLKPGGRLLLEVEGKWNFDMFWEIINGLCFNIFEYDESLREALRHIRPPWNVGHEIDYSFKLENDESVIMPLRLFTASELEKELKNVGLVQTKRWGLHSLTNVIPSTVLHKAYPSPMLKKIFSILSSIERRFNQTQPFNAFGCSLLMIAQKK